MQIADAEKIVPQNSPHTTTRKGASPPCRAAYHVVVSGTLLPSGAWPPCRARTSCCLVSLSHHHQHFQLSSAKCAAPAGQVSPSPPSPDCGASRHATRVAYAPRRTHSATCAELPPPRAHAMRVWRGGASAAGSRNTTRRHSSCLCARSPGVSISLRSFSLPCRHASRITLRSLGRLSHSRPLVANTPNVAISTLTHAAATGQPEAAARQAAARALQQPRAAEPSPPAPALRWSPPPPLPARPRHAQPQSCS